MNRYLSAIAAGMVLMLVTGIEAAEPVGFTTLNCDCNGDAGRDISDATCLLNFLFLGGDPPVEYRPDGVNPATTLQNGNCNGDELGIDISDATYVLNWLFLGGPPPIEESVAVDTDKDGVVDSSDNCPQIANADQLDTDADNVGDVCDNCPQVSNPGQEDTDEDNIGNACEVPTLYAGSLPATNGRWSFGGQLGVTGANALCASTFPNSTPCTGSLLQMAADRGELVGAKDSTGKTITSFWVLDSGISSTLQCGNSTATNIPWTYATAHTGDGGSFVTLGADGKLSSLNQGLVCGQSKNVACCNPTQ